VISREKGEIVSTNNSVGNLTVNRVDIGNIRRKFQGRTFEVLKYQN
jgi:hypothetical protein